MDIDASMALIDSIISLEWDMFAAVNEGGERASCQEDPATFYAMRSAQFKAWPLDALESYFGDLEAARSCGRNLVEEKYIHMMRTADPSGYEELLHRVTMPSAEAAGIARDISDALLGQTRGLYEAYPYTTGHGRPLYAVQDFSATSVETYQLGELLTYSVKTLEALKRHISALEGSGRSLAREILENTVRFYGYGSLEAAEEGVIKNI